MKIMTSYWYIWVGYLVLINVVAYILYWIDKRKAKAGKNSQGYSNKRRIPEAQLLGIAICGGSVGAYIAMHQFRHKTKHMKFVIIVPLAFILQCALIIYLFMR